MEGHRQDPREDLYADPTLSQAVQEARKAGEDPQKIQDLQDKLTADIGKIVEANSQRAPQIKRLPEVSE